jgi:hypothetical protein
VSDRAGGHHHPLPSDPRARHDLIPESVEDVRDRDEGENPDDPASPVEPPVGHYRDPDGRPYDT